MRPFPTSTVTRVALAATVTALGLLIGGPAAANPQPFAEWLAGLRGEALGRGLRPATLDAALADLEPIPRVIELDRKQPEFTMTMAEYLSRVVNPTRIAEGREKLAENSTLIAEAEARFGVQARFIVALWGIETNYGASTGGFPVIASLATLAYDGRRAQYFRSELLDALRIVDQGHIGADAMRGSWAGAMGQSQFMPSSFLRFAVDADGDGRKDIWKTRRDVFASIANYLKSVGWRGDQTWGRRVQLPRSFDRTQASLEIRRPIAAWAAAGVRSETGGPLPTPPGLDASIVIGTGPGEPSFMVYDNFNHLMRWNRSTYFATAVGVLSDRIGAR